MPAEPCVLRDRSLGPAACCCESVDVRRCVWPAGVRVRARGMTRPCGVVCGDLGMVSVSVSVHAVHRVCEALGVAARRLYREGRACGRESGALRLRLASDGRAPGRVRETA